MLLGRIADLEHRLEESEKARESEAESRRRWETDMLESLKVTRRQWQKAGGPELLVESALETLVDSMKERDALQLKMSKLVAALQDEPPDSDRTPGYRARLAMNQKKMADLQDKIDKQLALVQAWVERSKGTEE